MGLKKIKERVWIYPYDDSLDRPNLVYIKGDEYSIVVDAGHSKDHIDAFYKALKEKDFPFPKYTIITHFHWDHTFGMKYVSGETIANERTLNHLKELKEEIDKNGTEYMLNIAESIKNEYNMGHEMEITLPNIIYKDKMILDLGNYKVRIFSSISPHTDDSTLVYLENDSILVLGDSIYGTYPNWVSKRELAEKLIDTINEINPRLCISGHGNPSKKKDIIKVILGDVVD